MSTVVRGLRAPIRGATYRRGAFLLLGGALLLPYGLVAVGLARQVRDGGTPLAVVVPMTIVAAAIGLVPPLLRGARSLEIAAVRGLLDVDLPEPPERISAEARLRAALWFAVHLTVGGGVGLALFVVVPTAAVLVTTRTGWAAAGPAALSVAVLVATVYAVAGLGALARLMAPVLLGPSADERVAALEAEARRLAERNRLARDLHDSVGHALTVAVLQAGAAGQLLATDPAFVARALTAIEETGRAAMEDLDRVLGVLRDDLPAEPDGTRPDLGDLAALAHRTGAGLATAGPILAVPPALSQEAYRIVQEALTNALRHAGATPVSLDVKAAGTSLVVEVRNTLGGRGLAGMRERVTLLGGDLTAGPDGDQWRVRAELHW
jgi:signal transduction histidine kinase